MPTYEMICSECREQFETFACFADKDKTSCPSCGSKNLQQVYSSHVLIRKKPSSCGASSCGTCSHKCSG